MVNGLPAHLQQRRGSGVSGGEGGTGHSGVSTVVGLRPTMKNLSLEVVILQRVEKRMLRGPQGCLHIFLVADATGSIRLEMTEPTALELEPGDIIRLSGCEVRLLQQRVYLAPSRDFGVVKRKGRDTLHFSELPNMSEVAFNILADGPK